MIQIRLEVEFGPGYHEREVQVLRESVQAVQHAEAGSAVEDGYIGESRFGEVLQDKILQGLLGILSQVVHVAVSDRRQDPRQDVTYDIDLSHLSRVWMVVERYSPAYSLIVFLSRFSTMSSSNLRSSNINASRSL